MKSKGRTARSQNPVSPRSLLIGLVLGLVGGYFLGRSESPVSQTGLPPNHPSTAGTGDVGPVMDDATRMEMEAYREELEALRGVWEEDNEDWETALRVAEMYWEVAFYPQAVTWYERALAPRPNPDIQNDLGFATLLAGDVQGAIEVLKDLTGKHSDYARGWLSLGVAYLYGEENRVAAMEALSHAVSLNPTGEIGGEAARILDEMKEGNE